MQNDPITLLGQYIKDFSFENPISQLPPPDKNPTINLDVNTLFRFKK